MELLYTLFRDCMWWTMFVYCDIKLILIAGLQFLKNSVVGNVVGNTAFEIVNIRGN